MWMICFMANTWVEVRFKMSYHLVGHNYSHNHRLIAAAVCSDYPRGESDTHSLTVTFAEIINRPYLIEICFQEVAGEIIKDPANLSGLMILFRCQRWDLEESCLHPKFRESVWDSTPVWLLMKCAEWEKTVWERASELRSLNLLLAGLTKPVQIRLESGRPTTETQR
jgi:hypothetical protein